MLSLQGLLFKTIFQLNSVSISLINILFVLFVKLSTFITGVNLKLVLYFCVKLAQAGVFSHTQVFQFKAVTITFKLLTFISLLFEVKVYQALVGAFDFISIL